MPHHPHHIVFRQDARTVVGVHYYVTTDVRSPMSTEPAAPEPRPTSGDAHASPAIPEILQIGRELSALRNADLFTDPDFTWLD